MILIWFSGIIRGAIAFALSLAVDSKLAPNRSLIVSSTLVVVLVTTVVFGGLMTVFASILGIHNEADKINYHQLDDRPSGREEEFKEEHKQAQIGSKETDRMLRVRSDDEDDDQERAEISDALNNWRLAGGKNWMIKKKK